MKLPYGIVDVHTESLFLTNKEKHDLCLNFKPIMNEIEPDLQKELAKPIYEIELYDTRIR